MKRETIKVLLIKLIETFPKRIQKIFFRTIIESRFLFFKIKFLITSQKNIDPTKIYWISPNRIIKCLSPRLRKGYFNFEQIRGSVVGGDWDQVNCKFETNIDVFEAIKERANKQVEWQDTKYYKRILREVKRGNFLYGIKNKTDLDTRCRYLDSLYVNIKRNGYHLSRNIYHKNITFGEVEVNIGRDGDYIFRDGIHRLSIAKILGIKSIPINVFVRHKKWQDFRNFLFTQAKHCGRQLPQSPIHPDLLDIPYDKEPEEIWKKIKLHLSDPGPMLDITAKMGFWCQKFEDLGYMCYGIEKDRDLYQIMERIKKAEGREFQTFNKPLFELEFLKKINFKVVFALNIFQNLSRKKGYFELITFLKNFRTDILFIESSNSKIDQIKSLEKIFKESDLVNFIIENSSLSKSKLIYTLKSGRQILKLYNEDYIN
jgi:hypothetical protein